MSITSSTMQHSVDGARSLEHWLTWLVRRRVITSLSLFTALVLLEMFVLAVRPRDIFDWRDLWTVAGELLVLTGLAIRSWAAGTLAKCKSLIRVGPYAVVRNPLYIGSFSMIVGFCTLVGDWHAIWLIGPIGLLYALVVRHEESKLAIWFPTEWADYSSSTPRFLPRRWSPAALQGWSAALWLHNREHLTLIWSAVGLTGLAAWRALVE